MDCTCICYACTLIVDVPPEDLIGSTYVIPLECKTTGAVIVHPVPRSFRTDGFSLKKDDDGRYIAAYDQYQRGAGIIDLLPGIGDAPKP